VSRKPAVFARREGKSERRVAELAGRFLDATLDALVPPIEEYHLEMRGGAVVMRGFSPFRFLERVTVELDASGLPCSVLRERPGEETVRVLPRFEAKGGGFHLAGATIREGEESFEFSVEWGRYGGVWLPRRAEIHDGKQIISLTVRPRWSADREGF
jgi:hypothetical protein